MDTCKRAPLIAVDANNSLALGFPKTSESSKNSSKTTGGGNVAVTRKFTLVGIPYGGQTAVSKSFSVHSTAEAKLEQIFEAFDYPRNSFRLTITNEDIEYDIDSILALANVDAYDYEATFTPKVRTLTVLKTLVNDLTH